MDSYLGYCANDCKSNDEEHGDGKIHEKGISTEKFKSLVVVIIPFPDLGKIPQDKKSWNSRKSKEPKGSLT